MILFHAITPNFKKILFKRDKGFRIKRWQILCLTVLSWIGFLFQSGDGIQLQVIAESSNPDTEKQEFISDIRSVKVKDSAAYAVGYDRSSIFQIVDVQDPSAPVQIAALADTDFLEDTDKVQVLFDIEVIGPAAYIVDIIYGIYIVNVEVAESPFVVALFELYRPVDLFAVDNLLYVTSRQAAPSPEGRLTVIDISNSFSPVIIATVNLTYTSGIYVDGNYAYMTEGGLIRILDISDIENPVLVSTFRTPGNSSDLFIQNGIAYIANGDAGLQIFDVSNPATPIQLGSYDTPGPANSVAVNNNTAFVADGGDGGLQIIDVSNLSAPILSEAQDTPGEAIMLVDEANTVYVADGGNGLFIFPYTPTLPTPIPPTSTPIPDSIPPSSVNDLISSPDLIPGGVRLSWKAPGDNGMEGGPAARYDIRYSKMPIDESNWQSATQVNNEPTPITPGNEQEILVLNLTTGNQWFFAMKTYDKFGNSSGLSNIVSVQDSGFRPVPNGYNFSNGDILSWGVYPLDPRRQNDYTKADMIAMFGREAVCAREIGGICILKETAKTWRDEVNKKMNGGHCDGFVTTSLRFYIGDDEPFQFQTQANSTHDLSLANVRRHITKYYILQLLDNIRMRREESLLQAPAQILDLFRTAMSGTVSDPMTLIIYKDTSFTEGHSLVPYAIQYRGNDTWWIWVYDSNQPDDSGRYVIINSLDNNWSYAYNNDDIWSGDFNLNPPPGHPYSTLGGIPISLYNDPDIKCPTWCDTTESATAIKQPPSGEIWLDGKGHLLITDPNGRRLGYVDNQLVNEIPESSSFTPIGGLGIPQEPIYYVPLTTSYTILLDAQSITQTETVAVTQFGSGYAASVENINLESTARDEVTIYPDGAKLIYHPNEVREVTLTLALDNPDVSHKLQIQSADSGIGQQVEIARETIQGQMAFKYKAGDNGTYNLFIERISGNGLQIFIHNDLSIGQEDTHYVHYSASESLDSLMLSIDKESDGTIEQTVVLNNQILPIAFLPITFQ